MGSQRTNVYCLCRECQTHGKGWFAVGEVFAVSGGKALTTNM
jgi:hypothetical protein